MPTVTWDAFEDSLCFNQLPPEGYFYHLPSGNTFLRHPDADEEEPEDFDSEDWIRLPYASEVECGRAAYEAFAIHCQPDLEEAVCDCFRRRGAYRRVKDLFARHGCLEQWYAYERQWQMNAARRWAEDNGYTMVGLPDSD